MILLVTNPDGKIVFWSDVIINMQKEYKRKFEETYPETTEKILRHPQPDMLAIKAGLTRRQWDAVSTYLDSEDVRVSVLATRIGVSRPNCYTYLQTGFGKLETARRRGVI